MSRTPFQIGDRVHLTTTGFVVQDGSCPTPFGEERNLVLKISDNLNDEESDATVIRIQHFVDDCESSGLLGLRKVAPAQWPPRCGDVWRIGRDTWFIYPAPDAPSPRLASGPLLCARNDRGSFIDARRDLADELLANWSLGESPVLLARDGKSVLSS